MAHARFEPMMMTGDDLALQRRRLLTSALMAATVCLGAGVMTWVGDKMGITAVTPPKNAYSVSFQVLTPPPPAAPPPAVAAGGAQEQSQSEPEEVEPPEPDVAPTEVPKLDLDARPKAKTTIPGNAKGGPVGVPGGGPNGVLGGKPGSKCLIPPCLGDVVADPAILVQKKKTQPPVQAPIKTVMASSIYTPNPDQKRLSRTRTAMTHKKPGKTTVAFCINGKGETYDVRVRSKFGGDPQVDQICRETVSRWRFHPQKVGGKARSTCSKVTFDIRFD